MHILMSTRHISLRSTPIFARLLYVLLISASSAWAMAQPALALSTLTVPEANLLSGAIEGVVRDAETGEGLPLVNIQLGDSRQTG